jgi:alkylation response protein AidB-like acyl-CoA dehydrogenase
MITPTDEQRQLRATVRAFLEATCSHEHLVAQTEQPDGFDRAAWRRAGGELGLPGIAVPESYGGSGSSPAELVWVLAECGRALWPAPLFSSVVLATTALLASGDDGACRELLPAMAAGERIGTLAVAERRLLWTPEQIRTTAAGTGRDRRVHGAKTAVVDAHVADDLLVAARTGEGVSLLRVPADAPGVSVTPRPGFDRTRRLADVVFDGAPGLVVGEEGAGWEVLERVRDTALAALAAEAVGGMARLTDLAVAHARTREQFGVPIGSFQAVKHRIADMVVAVDLGERSAETLVWGLEADDDQTPIVAAAMFAHNADAYVTVAESALQVLGGIGFTAEHPAHLYVKRARASRALLGMPAEHRERIAPAILGARAA